MTARKNCKKWSKIKTKNWIKFSKKRTKLNKWNKKTKKGSKIFTNTKTWLKKSQFSIVKGLRCSELWKPVLNGQMMTPWDLNHLDKEEILKFFVWKLLKRSLIDQLVLWPLVRECRTDNKSTPKNGQIISLNSWLKSMKRNLRESLSNQVSNNLRKKLIYQTLKFLIVLKTTNLKNSKR